MTIDYYNLKEFKPNGYPVRHQRKVPFNPLTETPEGFVVRSRAIRDLDFELDRFILKPEDYKELIIDSYSSNVHWSTKVEGNPLSEAEVTMVTQDALNGKKTEKPSGPTQEILNHLAFFVMPETVNPPWTSRLLHNLHRFLLSNTGNKCNIGQYRTKEVSIYDLSELEVFIPAPASKVKEEMESLLDWVNRIAPSYDPVVASTVLFHEFESIHPFEDGNGRMGRSLFHLFMQNHGLPNSHLCKIGKELLSDTELYYQLLAYADDTGSYKELIDYVSTAILKSYENTHADLSKKDLLSSDLDEVSKRLLRRARAKKDWFSVSKACSWVTSIGEQTVRKHLNELVDIGVLWKRGKTRSCKFRIRDPMADLRDTVKISLSTTLKMP